MNTDEKINVDDGGPKILKLSYHKTNEYNRDTEYWNDYYKNTPDEISEPSNFARDMIKYMKPYHHLLDLGCGNGRDSLFFLNNNLHVTGIDAAKIPIRHLTNITKNNHFAEFVCDDFVKCRYIYQKSFDYIYSRFTLHAISKQQENELFVNVAGGLKKGGKLFIEARTIHDDLYGRGHEVEPNAFFYNGHFRRFINPDDLRDNLEKLELHIKYIEENRGFSKDAHSNPVLVRIIAIK